MENRPIAALYVSAASRDHLRKVVTTGKSANSRIIRQCCQCRPPACLWQVVGNGGGPLAPGPGAKLAGGNPDFIGRIL